MKESDIIWNKLMTELPILNKKYNSALHRNGIATLNFPIDYSPKLGEINEILAVKTRWQAYETYGFVSYEEYFRRILNYEFPVNSYERTLEEIYHSSQPDKFHDIYGHLPFLVDDEYTDVTLHLAEMAMHYAQDEYTSNLFARYYFHQFEFGLIREEGEIKVLGAGIATSTKEAESSIKSTVKHYKHNPVMMMEIPFTTDETIKSHYFIIEDLQDAVTSKDLVTDYIAFKKRRKKVSIVVNLVF